MESPKPNLIRAMGVLWYDHPINPSADFQIATLEWSADGIVSLIVNKTHEAAFSCPVTAIKSFGFSPDRAKLVLKTGQKFYLGLRIDRSRDWQTKWTSAHFWDPSPYEGIVVNSDVSPRDEREWWMSSFSENGVIVRRFTLPALAIALIIVVPVVLLVAMLSSGK